MSDKNTVYYRAAGRSLAALNKWSAAREELMEREREFATCHSAKDLMTNNSLGASGVCGAIFDGNAPSGWRKEDDYYVPDKRTKAGRAISSEMRKLTCPGVGIDVGDLYIADRHVYSPGAEQLGGDWIISHHPKATPPADAIPMARSEYWRMKEAESSVGAI